MNRPRRSATTAGLVAAAALGVGIGVAALASRDTGKPAAQSTTDTAITVGAVQNGGPAHHGRCRQPGPYQLPQGGETVHLDPADFTVRIDNPYWPMRPGTVWRFLEREGDTTQHVTVRVTHRTVRIEGVRARVVHDVVREDGEPVEDTRDWYAQDAGGSIWYLGEATRELEDGEVVSTEGSWRHGRDGAQAGVVVPARPRPGCSYREEYLAGEAEDQALVLALSEAIDSPTGFHRRLLHTANWSPVEPGVLENKFYARGLGPVVELDISPVPSRADLVSVSRP